MIGSYSFNPQLLVHGCIHPHSGQEFALRCPSFVGVFLRVQIQRGLNFRVTQDAWTVFGSTFALFTSQLLKLCGSLVIFSTSPKDALRTAAANDSPAVNDRKLPEYNAL